jgi:predicted PurR-regulated permease PerM
VSAVTGQARGPDRAHNVLFDLAAVVIVIAGIKAAEAVMVPFLLAAFIAIIAATPVFWLRRHRVPVWASVILVVLVLLGAFIGIGAIVSRTVDAFLVELPFYQQRATELTRDLGRWLVPLAASAGLELDVEHLSEHLDAGAIMRLVGSTLAGFSGALGNSLLILMTVVFILLEASSFPRKLAVTLSDPAQSLPHFERFTRNVNRYMAIKTTASLVNGVLVWLVLLWIGVDFAALWGLLAFLFNYVPNIGSLISSVPPVLLAALQLGPAEAALAAFGCWFVNFVPGLIEPRFMGQGLGLSTLIVFVSLVFWGWALGPVGMLLSVPLTMTVKIALEASPRTHWIALLLGPATEADAEAAPPSAAAPQAAAPAASIPVAGVAAEAPAVAGEAPTLPAHAAAGASRGTGDQAT